MRFKLLRSIVSVLLASNRNLGTMEYMRVKKLTDLATIPVRGTEFAAGFDLSSAYDATVPARGKALVKTDIAISIPENTYARVAPRSGLAWKNSIDVGAGVIDYDYRGNVGVILFNLGDVDFEVKKGDRIAQLILERISMAPAIEVEELAATERGAGGFGSTGVSNAVPTPPEEGSKKPRIEDDESKLSEQLLFWESVPLNDEKRRAAKALVLTGDKRIHAAMLAYRSSNSLSLLEETVDLILA